MCTAADERKLLQLSAVCAAYNTGEGAAVSVYWKRRIQLQINHLRSSNSRGLAGCELCGGSRSENLAWVELGERVKA